jgi:hypothetical protein
VPVVEEAQPSPAIEVPVSVIPQTRVPAGAPEPVPHLVDPEAPGPVPHLAGPDAPGPVPG